MQQSAQNNLFTAFNNIEKIKKEKQERKLKPVIRVEEMIKTIKEHYNLNAPMLAHNLGVDVQAIYRWEKGSRPNIKRYNKIKELYEEIIRENKTEVLEQPVIANKEVIEDATAGTPFIELNRFNTKYENNLEPFYINVREIVGILNGEIGGSIIRLRNKSVEFRVLTEEEPAEVLELIRKKIKENEKN